MVVLLVDCWVVIFGFGGNLFWRAFSRLNTKFLNLLSSKSAGRGCSISFFPSAFKFGPPLKLLRDSDFGPLGGSRVRD